MIRTVSLDDASSLTEIYNNFVESTEVTFEETPISSQQMSRRIESVTEIYPWLVFECEGRIVGYAYATAWRERSAYRHSVESTIYLAADVTGNGIGTVLYKALLEHLGELDVHCVIGGVALPNPASVALHEKLGFEKVAHFRQVGRKHKRWIDVGYWQKIVSDNASDEDLGE